MPDLEQRLLTFLTDHYGPIELSDIHHISDGWENDVYSFKYRPADAEAWQTRILRIYPGDNALEKSTHEFTGMQKLYEVGLPVPQVLHHTADAFDKPAVIMEFVEGIPLAEAVVPSSESQAAAMKFDFTNLFVRLHSLDVTPFLTPELPASAFDDPYWFVNGLLKRAETLITGPMQEPFAPVMDWLRAHMHDVPCERPSLMHGDYHFRNILYSSNSEPFVIDWTNWQVGDYRYDLAWTLLILGNYGNPHEATDFLKSYELISEEPVPNLYFYEVVAATRRLLDILMVFYASAESWGLRPEAGDLIRKYPQHVWTVYQRLCDRTDRQYEAIHAMINAAL